MTKNCEKTIIYLEVDWHETGKAQPWLPVLTYRLPLKTGCETVLCDVPAGWVERPAQEMDIPALTGVCAKADLPTAALITDCKYGFRMADGVLSATLINTAIDPDPYPERGVHAIKLFVGLTDSRHVSMKQMAERLTRPMTCVPTATHAGKLPARASLLGVEAEGCVVTSVQLGKDDALLVRLYEAEGEDKQVTLTLPFEPGSAVLTNLNEEITGSAQVEGNNAAFTIGAHHIAQIKLTR